MNEPNAERPTTGRIIDVDAHLGEPMDWLEVQDPALAAEFPSSVTYLAMIREAAARTIHEDLPDEIRPATATEMLSEGFMDFLALTASLQPERTDLDGEDPSYTAAGRLRFCDERGIDVQFLNPTYWRREHMWCRMIGRPDLRKAVTGAWNSYAARQTEGHTDRLIPVTQIFTEDPEWSVQEMARMRELGSRAFSLDAAPVSKTKSITHPDLDIIWAAAVDLDMTMFFHAGNQDDALHPGWAANGGHLATAWMLQQLIVAGTTTARLALAAFVADGVFERFPGLRVIVEELGSTWMPEFLIAMDRLFDPSSAGSSYRQPLPPTEYIRRQVKLSPLTYDPLSPTIRLLPPGTLLFSTDYPHPEGRENAVDIFDEMLKDEPTDVREDFFGRTAEAFLGV